MLLFHTLVFGIFFFIFQTKENGCYSFTVLVSLFPFFSDQDRLSHDFFLVSLLQFFVRSEGKSHDYAFLSMDRLLLFCLFFILASLCGK